MRVVCIPTLTTSPSHADNDSAILLTSKLCDRISRTGRDHIHLFLPRSGLDKFYPREYCTVREASPVIPASSRAVLFPGPVVSPFGIYDLLHDIGPDVIITTNVLTIPMFSWYLGVMRSYHIASPRLLLWDFSPMTPACTDNSAFLSVNERAGFLGAVGYASSDKIWSFSADAANAAIEGVARSCGYSVSEAVRDRMVVKPLSIDLEYMRRVIGEEPPVKRDKFTVHIGGRWSATKRYDVIAKVITTLRASGVDDIGLVYTGIELSKTELAQSEESGMESFYGFSQEDAWRFISTCHVGVFLQNTLGVPSMPLEQLALGLPVLIHSTSFLHKAVPCYPFVFETESDLAKLLLYVKANYVRCCQEVREWSSANLQNYDFGQLGQMWNDLEDSLLPVPGLDKYNFSVSDSGIGSLSIHDLGLSRMVVGSLSENVILRRCAKLRGYDEDFKSSDLIFCKREGK